MTRIVITGTPCTGKTTLAKELAKHLKVPLIDSRQFENKCILGTTNGEKTIDLNKLERNLRKATAGLKGFVVEGHLLCETRIPCDSCVVLRCDPRVLEKRLKSRKYAQRKIDGNLLAEMLDYCLVKAESNYKTVVQINFTKPKAAKTIAARIASNRSDSVDFSRQLLSKRFRPLLAREQAN